VNSSVDKAVQCSNPDKLRPRRPHLKADIPPYTSSIYVAIVDTDFS